MAKKNLKFLFVILITSIHSNLYSQSSIWGPSSFSFSRDTTSFEDMTGATSAAFSGNFSATALASFPSGFSFQFGLNTYTTFTISSYGYIKFGRVITAVNPTSQDTLISALYCFNNTYTASYKTVGTAPNRRFIIDWSGNYNFVGPVRFQLWLYERIGRIQFVYSGQNAYSLGNGYAIYCKTRILNQPVLAWLTSAPNNQLPTINYSALQLGNYDYVAPKTRYTFQPDTIKPTSSSVSFANVLAGCLDVVVKDNSVNEKAFFLERKDSGTTYKQIGYVLSATDTTVDSSYVFHNSKLQPDSSYSFRVFSTNGFTNSDTFTQTLHTPMPMISGVKKIPGDYPSINALLQDAQCKHLGPELTVELQASYSYANEGTGTVYVNPFLQTKLLRRVTIAPAAGTNVVISAANSLPLFIVDSVRNFGFDGRAGGTGIVNNLTIRQLDTLRPAISYTHFADSGFINYCNVEGRCMNASFGLIYLGGHEPYLSNFTGAGVSGTVIANCKIGPATGFNLKGIVVEPNGRGQNYTIRENEFFRFYNEAIEFRGGGDNSHIVKNRLYQPDVVSFLPNTNQSNGAMYFSNTGNGLVVDSNRFGGAAAPWGTGNWNQYVSPNNNNYAMIYLKPSYVDVNSYIRNNEIANITYTGASACEIRVVSGRVTISNNRIGSADSVNSIVQYSHHTGVAVYSSGLKVISGNFMSGLQTDYPNFSTSQTLSMLYIENVDSLLVTGNDIGGSDNPLANRSGNRTFGIDLSSTKYAVIKNNSIRGISSVYDAIAGISEEWHGSTASEKNMVADSNKIHHLEGKLTAYGIAVRLSSNRKNSFSNNEIYSIRAIGPYTDIGVSHPDIILGIIVESNLFPDQNAFDSSEIMVSKNKIHSFEYYTPTAFYDFPMRAIAILGRKIKIQNNMIQLGIGSNGRPTDSLELEVHGIAVGPSDVDPTVRAEIEHNSIYIGGTGQTVSGISFPVNASENKNIFLSNNIIQIERYEPSSISNNVTFISAANNTANIRNVISNNNIWYTQHVPDINQQLNNWKSICECDSATFIGNPLFINPEGDSISWNLHLSPGSLADSSGTPPFSPILRDIDNDLRTDYSPVDIGADAITPCSGNLSSVQLQLSAPQDTINVCSGDNHTLNVSVTGGTINQLQWQRDMNDISGATGNSYTVSQSGFYRVIGQLNCGKISSKPVLAILGGTPPIFNVMPTDTTICAGMPVTLTANGIASFTWSPSSGLNTTNGNTVIAQPVVSTIYMVTGSSAGCSVTKSVNIKVNPSVAPTVSIDSSNCTSSSITFHAQSTNGGNAPVYQWYVDNSLADTGSTIVLHNVANGSSVYVKLISGALCANPSEINSVATIINCIVTGVPNINGLESIFISPNPTNESINLRIKLNQLKKTRFALVNGAGQVLYNSEAKNITGANDIQIDVRKFPAGLYYLRITIDGNSLVKKIIISRY